VTDPAIPLADIQTAAAVLAGFIVDTPCLHSRTLSQITGAGVYVKFENLQFTASFKERGALFTLKSLTADEARRGVIAMSAGNHAQGVAYHAGRLGIPATIVMPANTPFTKVTHTRNFGADVVLHGETLSESETYVRAKVATDNLVLVHPYDDRRIITGQGTIGLEMLVAHPDLDMLVVPIGGGGLISGIASAAKAIKPSIRIIGVECANYPSMSEALAGRHAVPGGQTIAEGIAVKNVGQLTLPIVRALVDDIVVVSEEDLERAIALFLMVEKTVAEGAGAAGLAALLARPDLFAGKRTGLVLCGGNIDPRLLSQVINRELVREGRLTGLRIRIFDRPGALADITRIIGEAGGNIIDVIHQRLFMDVPAKGADVDLLIETRDASHVGEITARLRDLGYAPRILSSSSE
jgi:threonine dehydratase